jgi:hypothetical protein
MPKIGLNVETKTGIKSRLETLYYFVYEMAQSFGVSDSSLESIKKGILDRKIISEIVIKYFNNRNVVVGRVKIKINWEKHELMATTDYGAFFTFDTSKSIRSQVSEVSDIIIEHVTNMRNALKIVKIESNFVYTDEITNDASKNKEAMKYLGHVYGSFDKESITKDFTSSMEWLCDKLREVKIIIEHS